MSEDNRSKKWYEENKEAHNQSRRERYAQDPEYRERTREQARVQAAKRRNNAGAALTRKLDGVTYEVVKLSAVAESCGVVPDTIKRAHDKGAIPPCSFSGTHRVYTKGQEAALVKFYNKQLDETELADLWDPANGIED